ncbi:hypothetical protein [Mucilaginibacter sp. SP1R1]|uniref:hypothetical protein n=1 Tax=Mucilaginibacter sp. SP1R1 TaxID=2723091 RepID=UPI001622315E|nr:hypothetical protein [Mucilaginibacter sp. SP1R1]MBB6149393.1 hypothetical protein [Mucilaginibacter sp. SP1R1]
MLAIKETNFITFKALSGYTADINKSPQVQLLLIGRFMFGFGIDFIIIDQLGNTVMDNIPNMPEKLRFLIARIDF